MWGIIITVFLGLYGLMSYYIGHRGWTTIGKPATRLYQWLYWFFFLLLVLSFPLAKIGEDIWSNTVASFLTIWGGYSMVAVSYLFLLLLTIDILRFLDKKVGFVPVSIKEHKKTPITLGAIVVLFVLATTFYGSWNARNPIIKEYELAINKNAGSMTQLRIAMISDIHYGVVIDTQRLERLLDMVRSMNPDIILLAGDITDGALPQGESAKLAAVLGQMEAPYGIYAVPGNHDRDLRDVNGEFIRDFEQAGIHVLKDDSILVGDSLYLIGRDDPNRRTVPSRKDLADLMSGIDATKPLILMDHQPIGLEEAQAGGIDLQVSGHTHNGQIFPANLITGQIYEQDWGLLQKGAYHLIVSCGFGTWGPPLNRQSTRGGQYYHDVPLIRR